MSLTTLLDSPEVKARFSEEFPKPSGPGKAVLAAPPAQMGGGKRLVRSRT